MRHSHGCLLRAVLILLCYKGTYKIVGVVGDKRKAILSDDPWDFGPSRQKDGRPINWMGTLASG